MHYHEPTSDEEDRPLVDLTKALAINSKRSTREQKKRHKKEKARKNGISMLDLPSELVIDILGHLLPRDVFVLSRVSKHIRQFVKHNEGRIAKEINNSRYAVLQRCLQPPLLLDQIEESSRHILQSNERSELSMAHKNWYQHILPPNSNVICTCRSCIMAWNNLCLIVDFCYWQDHLDNGDPLPIIPRGQFPAWNQAVIVANASTILESLYSPLLLGAVFEKYLQSIVRSIHRQRENKGNKRRRFRMSEEDVAAETDAFLERSGPPSVEIPYTRDKYYMLEAYLPNRAWIGEQSKWGYAGSMHSWDLERLKAEAALREKQKTSSNDTLRGKPYENVHT